jgi:hypothetical protein
MQFLQRGQQTEPTGLKNICTGAVTHVLMITCKTSFKVPLKDLQRGNSNAFMQKEETPEWVTKQMYIHYKVSLNLYDVIII